MLTVLLQSYDERALHHKIVLKGHTLLKVENSCFRKSINVIIYTLYFFSFRKYNIFYSVNNFYHKLKQNVYK